MDKKKIVTGLTQLVYTRSLRVYCGNEDCFAFKRYFIFYISVMWLRIDEFFVQVVHDFVKNY